MENRERKNYEVLKLAGDIFVGMDGKVLVRLEDHGSYYRALKLPRCSIGDYFAVLSCLVDWGYNAR